MRATLTPALSQRERGSLLQDDTVYRTFPSGGLARYPRKTSDCHSRPWSTTRQSRHRQGRGTPASLVWARSSRRSRSMTSSLTTTRRLTFGCGQLLLDERRDAESHPSIADTRQQANQREKGAYPNLPGFSPRCGIGRARRANNISITATCRSSFPTTIRPPTPVSTSQTCGVWRHTVRSSCIPPAPRIELGYSAASPRPRC